MYSFRKMDNLSATEILNWHYSEPYDFYDLKANDEELHLWESNIEKNNWRNTYSAHDNGENLIGYFNFKIDKKSLLLNLRMCPSLTNKKAGVNYISEVISYINSLQLKDIDYITINVVAFNKKALNILGKNGFSEERHLPFSINGVLYDFINLKKDLN